MSGIRLFSQLQFRSSYLEARNEFLVASGPPKRHSSKHTYISGKNLERVPDTYPPLSPPKEVLDLV